jgi:GAF domain-containing protein/anti-sigma regulatory factor (Ser/Thr protein kinase)
VIPVSQAMGADDRARRGLEALQRVTDAALAYLSLDELLAELLDRITDILTVDTVAFLLLDERADELVARAARGIEEEVEQGVRIPLGRGFAGRIAAERRPIVIDDVDHADIFNPILREKGIRSLLGVPLLVAGHLLGVLHVGTLTPRKFTAADRDLLQLAGDRAALAIEHARLYQAEREARLQAEHAAETLVTLQRVTDAALAYLSLDELLAELLDRIADILAADTVAFLLLDERADTLVARAAKGIEEEVEQGVRIPVGRGFAGRIAAERRAVIIDDVDHADILNPLLREKGIRSLLGVPLLVEGHVLGVLHVGTLTPRKFTAADRDLLQLAADRAALAIEHAHLYEQRRLVEALQRALLPDPLVEIPGLELAARYVPAAVGLSIGGDWYDAFDLGGGRVGLVIGDVMGRGVGAAALMAQMRTALRAYAMEGQPPAPVAERLNRLLASLGDPGMTTFAYLVLDLERESGLMVSAGHLPPLLLPPGGEPRFLDVVRDPPVGVMQAVGYHEHRFDLPVGSTLVVFTDGAVEVRGEALDEGLERMRRLARDVREPDPLCEAIARGDLLPQAPYDDVAVLAARLAPLPDRLRQSWSAEARQLGTARHLLRRWLAKWEADPDDVYDITVAVGEACANAIEHAYAPGPAAFEVDAEHEDGVVTVVVRDRGGWREPRGEHRGRGLPIMEALMDAVEVRHDAGGTAMVLRRALRGAARA